MIQTNEEATGSKLFCSIQGNLIHKSRINNQGNETAKIYDHLLAFDQDCAESNNSMRAMISPQYKNTSQTEAEQWYKPLS